MKPEELEHLVERLLTEGVPAGVVARVFDLSPELVREAQSLLRIRRYGTDDLAEYTVQTQWDAIEQARHVLVHGSPSERAKFAAAVLRAPMARSARETPEQVQKTRAAIEEVMAAMRGGGEPEPVEEGERSRFVAVHKA